jgi:hypothetical protein
MLCLMLQMCKCDIRKWRYIRLFLPRECIACIPHGSTAGPFTNHIVIV